MVINPQESDHGVLTTPRHHYTLFTIRKPIPDVLTVQFSLPCHSQRHASGRHRRGSNIGSLAPPYHGTTSRPSPKNQNMPHRQTHPPASGWKNTCAYPLRCTVYTDQAGSPAPNHSLFPHVPTHSPKTTQKTRETSSAVLVALRGKDSSTPRVAWRQHNSC
jgi:hypothetical protein